MSIADELAAITTDNGDRTVTISSSGLPPSPPVYVIRYLGQYYTGRREIGAEWSGESMAKRYTRLPSCIMWWEDGEKTVAKLNNDQTAYEWGHPYLQAYVRVAGRDCR